MQALDGEAAPWRSLQCLKFAVLVIAGMLPHVAQPRRLFQSVEKGRLLDEKIAIYILTDFGRRPVTGPWIGASSDLESRVACTSGRL